MTSPREVFPEFNEFSIIHEPPPEPWMSDKWWLWGYGEYEESSVLAGQDRAIRLEAYDTLQEAKDEWPGVEVLGGPPIQTARVSDIAPSDFSELDAGERWNEEE